jgi:hypothetical protein
MVIRTVLIVSGIFALAIAALFVFAPEAGIDGFHLGPSEVASRLFARNFGLGLAVLGIINILACADPGSRALRALILGNILIHIGSPLVDLTENFQRDAGWYVSLLVHLGFVIAFGYCLANWTRLTGTAPLPPPTVPVRRRRGRA